MRSPEYFHAASFECIESITAAAIEVVAYTRSRCVTRCPKATEVVEVNTHGMQQSLSTNQNMGQNRTS